MLAGNDLGAGMEIARPRVIAKPLPGMQHIVERRRRQRCHIRPAFEKPRKIRPDGRNRRLLQHDFAEPDAIRRRPFPRQGTPGQLPPMAVVPSQQQRGEIGRRLLFGSRGFDGTGHSTEQ